MKTKNFALAVALGLVALVAGPVHATDIITTYTINFTTTSGSPAPASGSFTYDSSINQFSNFLVTWDGLPTFDLTALANAPFTNGNPTGCAGESSTPGYGFVILSQSASGCTGGAPVYEWVAGNGSTNSAFEFELSPGGNFGLSSDSVFSNPSCMSPTGCFAASASGGWSLTAVTAAPEPAPAVLLGTGLFGLMGMGLYKKRLVSRLSSQY